MDSSDQDAFDKARFATVLQNLKRDNIPSFASAVRYSGHPSMGTIDLPTTPRPVDCRLLSHITCGSFNAVITLLFADGTLWVLKVPATGHQQCWDAPAAEALTSEASTMRLIRRETTIPVPEVFAFDGSLENELGCPFILMELIHGKPLIEVWFDQGLSQAKREQIRIRSLHEIAEAMAQLNTLTFSQGGSLLFDAKGEVSGIGSSNVVDLETQYANMRSVDYDNTMAFCQTGPFRDPKTYFLSLVDAREVKRERGIVEQGAYKLLRLFLEWSLMDTSAVQEKPFVLAHPDLDNQNILVNDDGSLAGIIDWDWISAVPNCIGSQSLPKFLTQDYDPGNYAYDVETGKPKENCVADSPAQLASYRAMYAQFMESYLSKDDQVNLARSRWHAARVRKLRKEAADITRRSLIITSLYLAARAPSEMQELMMHLFDELEELTAAEWSEESSTADSREQDSSEEGDNEDGDTEASELDDSDVVGKGSCIQNEGYDEKAFNIEHLSIDELVDEIEKLSGISSAGKSYRELTQDPADLEETSPAKEKMKEPDVDAQGLSIVEHTKEDRKPRAARVCGWFKEKLRRGAKRLHRKSKKGDLIASAVPSPTPKTIKAARTFCGWTERKLRRVAHCLHCDDDNEDRAKMESKVEMARRGGVDVLMGLQTRLMQLRQKLHCKESNTFKTSVGGEKKALQNQQATSVSKELTRAEKRYFCGKFAQLVEDNKLCLTVDQQVAVAHWVIQILQNPDISTHDHPDGKAEHPEGDEYGRVSDPGSDSGYEEGPQDGDGSSADDRDGNEFTEDTEHQHDGQNAVCPMDQPYLQQPSDPLLSGPSSHLGTETARTTSGEEAPIETSQPAIGPKTKKPVQEDTGGFYMLDVCIALAKDDLDDRRMQRLRDGFFALLNQTL
ncbi:MAG: hypothetical protein ASARMPREDX12_005084 [Alectoria sarmentosa]|nr:MAG: hypothetical protein ASARMPREDX12_005084 [Alectoria sarmentosa]